MMLTYIGSSLPTLGTFYSYFTNYIKKANQEKSGNKIHKKLRRQGLINVLAKKTTQNQETGKLLACNKLSVNNNYNLLKKICRRLHSHKTHYKK